MAKKKKQSGDLMDEIKKMEAKKREEAMKKVEKVDETISFDAWWMLRSPKIPRKHMKEIISADFKGRGLEGKQKAEDFDKALAAYGLKL